MPSNRLPLRRPHEDVDSEDEVSTGDESSTGSQSSKRQRLSPEASSKTSENDVLPPSWGSHSRQRPAKVHARGAIVRIKVKNFVTYTATEFRLGPNLNMILGPNGTGKSTVVCAICLGLGSKPSVLGRAKDIGEYVKHGYREADVEIELAVGPGSKDPNPVIGHNIKREGNKSTYTLNGKRVSHQEIVNLTKSYHIQIDNLCQFLPQDRVVEFAKMTPVQLLESTQKAAAPEEMTTWHNTLKKLGADRKTRLATQEESRNELNKLQARQNQEKADVDRLTERANLQTRVNAYEKCKPIVQYNFEKTKYEEMRTRKQELEAEYNELQAEVEPTLAELNAKKEYKNRLVQCVQHRKKLVEKMEVICKNDAKKLEDLREKLVDCDSQMDVAKSQYKRTQTDMTKTRNDLSQAQHQLEMAPPELDTGANNEKVRLLNAETRKHTIKIRELDQGLNDIQDEARNKKLERSQLHADLERLRSRAGQQQQKIAQVSSDAAKAWSWLQRNQNIFKEKVYGPAIVECNIKDPRYAAAVESMLSAGEFLCFTATNNDDWKLLQDRLMGDLRLTNIHTRNCQVSLGHFKSPMSPEELEECGLDGFAIDYLEGPEPVLSMLCDNRGLHRSAVSLRTGNDEQYERLKDSAVQSWVAGKRSYKISRRREYGPDAVSTSVGQISDARFWTGQSVDRDAENSLNAKIREVETDLGAMQDRHEETKQEIKELDKLNEGIATEKASLQKEKDAYQKIKGELAALPTRIANLEDKIKSLHDSRDEYMEARQRILDTKQNICLERGQAAIQYSMRVGSLRSLHTELFQAELWSIEADSELHLLNERSAEVKRMLDDRKKEVQELSRSVLTQKEVATKLARQIKVLQMEMTDELEIEIWSEYGQDPETTPASLDAKILETKQRIELLHGGNPNAIIQYEKRKRDIEKLTQSLENFERDLATLNDEIKEIRDQWEPKLEEIVANISAAFTHNFQQIGCAGQVGVHKDDEDFKEWAIELKVKFREHEQLSILDSHRQSGGERAVSTVFFLMALQSLARSPFRVVDEINQGMDPRNERMVHERMVDIACKENTSQYFLITPKLLSGLRYDARMQTHIIYSGQTMPEETGPMNLKNYMQIALRVGGKAN
ncbi:structural maintenance of chromosome complex subunit SmcA [Tothia fuscella]|uniref:Structural maintenance of chromosomes protein 5 n=1 Tax=Tothia fuscella TaxID=1048955 RepID=A0A9P4NYQ3_9PEZI|nr:structural maintenance of chromosome complex subunit SmcA [Tothia fuscella]